MTILENAREQLLSQIELELCRIYETGSKVSEKLREFNEHIAELPLTHFIFNWYLINYENIQNLNKIDLKSWVELMIGPCNRVFSSCHSWKKRYFLPKEYLIIIQPKISLFWHNGQRFWGVFDSWSISNSTGWYWHL